MLTLIPYTMQDGHWTLPDAALQGIWAQMVIEGHVKTVFCQGGVRTQDQWFEHCKNPANVIQTVWNGDDLVLVAWLNKVSWNHAMGHFCGFKAGYGKVVKEAGRLILDYWFDILGLQVVIGCIPEHNRLALKYILGLGFEKGGFIPGIIRDVFKHKAVGAVFVYKTREVHHG